MPDAVATLFRRIDAKDAAGFAGHLAVDGTFIYGNQPPVRGRAQIEQFVAGFFSAIRSLGHAVADVWHDGDTTICRGTVTYTRLDGSTLTIPFCNVLGYRGAEIVHYQVYIDVSPLFAPG
jgi:ketosteroid isomerase-like protein